MTVDFTFADYGSTYAPGLWGLTATGINQATALPLRAKYNHFGDVAPGTGAMLPYVPASKVLTIIVLNRGLNALLVYPAPNGQIEALGLNAPISIPANGFGEFMSFDSVMAPGRQWFANILT